MKHSSLKYQKNSLNPKRENPLKPDPNPDPTKRDDPNKVDPTRIEEPEKNDPTRIDDPEPTKPQEPNIR
ncbi:MAG: hypothetical protein K0S53_2564 [Bacteroidetes bacterium]|jgi:hypothetical protein|nr:hypothetical protein [Bacteroidota bacterium]MDF2453907.1 hypothetical protein [Bacteroidota bacterium]